MRPEHVYYAALLFVALPLSLVSRLAAILTTAGAAACFAYKLSIPMPAAYVMIHWAALAACIGVLWHAHIGLRSIPALAITVAFLPMLAFSLCEMGGTMGPADAWAARLAIVLGQIALVPLTVNWSMAFHPSQANNRHDASDNLLKRVALA